MAIECSLKGKLIGEILQDVGLISSTQIEVALADQKDCCELRLGEILVARGWIKQTTVDFFMERFSSLCRECCSYYHPIEYYLKKADLLNEQEIDSITKEQKRTGIDLCKIAVDKGYLNDTTVKFFLENFCFKCSNFAHNSQTEKRNLTSQEIDTFMPNMNIYQDITEKRTFITSTDTLTLNDGTVIEPLETIYCNGIFYSRVWIDLS